MARPCCSRRHVLLSFAALTACGRKKPKVSAPTKPQAGVARPRRAPPAPPPPIGTTETGAASWYGKPYDGRQAANGEIYDMEKLTAAHRTLPFSTWVRVENVANGKSVNVRITDRGPFVGERIIDLSHAAAREIEMIGPGVANVRVVVIQNPEAPEPGVFAVQVGLFRSRENAERLQARLIALYGTANVVEREGSVPLYRVLAGALSTPEAAEELAIRIRGAISVPEAYVVRLDPKLN
jgi:rare lipoprotein A